MSKRTAETLYQAAIVSGWLRYHRKEKEGDMATVEAIVFSMQRGAQTNHGGSVPLYMFPMTDKIQEDLALGLRAELARTHKLGSVYSAAFCLFCSYEFCRSHKGGPWAWETALGPLAVELSPAERTQIAERGLAFWKRELIETQAGREFLTTLVCEGGLPLALLRQDNSRLTHYFRSLLQEAETFPHVPVVELAACAPIAAELAMTLRVPVVFTLAAQLISLIRDARQRIPLSASNLLQEAQQLEGWVDKLPIKVDDFIVQRLLEGLLAERQAQTQSTVISLHAHLECSTGRLLRKALVPSRVAATALATLLEQQESLPVRFILYLRSEGARTPLAIATQFGNEYALERIGQDLPFAAHERVQLVARLGEKLMATVSIPGGDPLPDDLPWVFTNDNDAQELSLLGCGDLTTRRDSVLIVVPENSTISHEVDGSSTEQAPVAQRRSYIVSGSLAVEVGDELWRIECSASHDNTSRFMLRGMSCQLGMNGSSVFLGLPAVWSLNDDCYLQHSELEWRSANDRKEQWRRVDRSSVVGDVVVRQIDANGSRFRARIQVLPSDCRWEFSSRTNGSSVRFSGVGAEEAGMPTTPLIKSAIEIQMDHLAITLDVVEGGETPATFPLHLRFANSELSVNVSFPTDKYQFLDWHGNEVKANTAISITELATLRAVVQTPRSSADFIVYAKGNHSSERTVGHLQRSSSGGVELPLDLVSAAVSSILAEEAKLDMTVRVGIRRVSEGRGHVLEVRRYDRKINKDREDGKAILYLDHPFLPGECNLKAARFEDGLIEFAPLTQIGTNRWELVFSEWEVGAWLVVADVAAEASQGISIRPIRITVAAPREDDGETAIQRLIVDVGGAEKARAAGLCGELTIARTSCLGSDDRLAAIGGILERLVENLGDPDWKAVISQLSILPGVPAASIDLARVLVNHPLALVLLMLKRPRLAAKIWMELETLPFMWKLVPMETWVLAANRFAEFGKTDNEDDSRENTIWRLETILDSGQRLEPCLGLVRLYLKALGFDIEIKNCVYPNEERYEQARQRMLRRPLDSHLARWPAWDWRRTADQIQLPPQLRDSRPVAARQSVLHAPVISAYAFIRNQSFDSKTISLIRSAHDFDSDWFEISYLRTLRISQ